MNREIINFNERNVKVELQHKIDELENKKKLVAKVDLFSDDENDEFKVRIGEENIGIFKTWAVPVIPILEGKTESWDGIDNWSEKMRNNPVSAWETLELWRGQTEIADRRLYSIFCDNELPADKSQRIAELFWRLKIAFGYAAPFYHIEAMVGDTKDTFGNPFGHEEQQSGGGFLDMAGMLLPSALEDEVMASRLNWNYLDWSQIKKIINNENDLTSLGIILRVARAAGIKAEEVVFAANSLEWIPVSVGGKKGDLPKDLAQEQLLDSSIRKGVLTVDSVARDMNGLIRFLNWTPLIMTDKNFSESSGWKYSAVCETSNAIIDELNDGELIDDRFRDQFLMEVIPQLMNLDASSARGRFAMWMFENGWFKKDLNRLIEKKEKDITVSIAKEMVRKEKEETIIDIGDSNSRFLIGGKAAGLYEAAVIFGKEVVGDGVVITTETVNKWLNEQCNLTERISRLDSEVDINKRLEIGKEIQQIILENSFPEEVVSEILNRVGKNRLAIRSSSFDEDTVVNGTAAGIYESEVNIDPADLKNLIPAVIASFFSEKAISYRHLHGLIDRPLFAVVVHEFVNGRGGAVFSNGNGSDWSVFTGENPGAIVSGGDDFDRIEKKEGNIFEEAQHNWVERELVDTIGEMSLLAEAVLGGKVDMEFLIDEGRIKILQLRMLNSVEKVGNPRFEKAEIWYEVSSIENIAGFEFETGEKIGLILDSGVNIDQFQGELFRCLVRNKGMIVEINLRNKIPMTSHFANICLNLGIKLTSRND